MHLGIDVGGTHTDAVAMFQGEVAAACKVKTDHTNLMASIRAALDDVLGALKGVRPTRLNLSTTLSTNAIVEGKSENVGVLVSAGPGVDPDYFHIGRNYHVIPGAIDHRGFEIKPLDGKELDAAIASCRQLDVRSWAVVGKFSPRNPNHELRMRKRIGPDADHVSLGHRISGLLNFPRRVSTAYYNAAVWRLYNTFADAVERCMLEYELDAPVNILKADGGTMPLALSRELPVESILSGPAASVMGIIALCEIRQDCVILDIGGTTTDIAFFAEGAPVIETAGIEVGSYPTLVRAMKTHSIGIGGDSRLHIIERKVYVGPEREGPALAMGGKTPTLIDACNFLGLSKVADAQASRQGVEALASLWDISPKKLAQEAVDYAVAAIKYAVEDLVWNINQKPVYTIGELLSGKELRPRKIYCMGGPAKTFQPLLAKAFGLEVVVPHNYAVANAIGAALTRTSLDLELFADTNKGLMFIPNLGVETPITSSYTLKDAERDAKRHLADYLETLDVHDFENVASAIDTTEAVSFNMVDDTRGSGRIIRVKCQIRPGILR
jgi:N-methylhydantoinase A/oxoprolinase/acetone carboxylase beta subunit